MHIENLNQLFLKLLYTANPLLNIYSVVILMISTICTATLVKS